VKQSHQYSLLDLVRGDPACLPLCDVRYYTTTSAAN